MHAFLKGLGGSLSIAAGYFPVAISFGLAAMEAGLPAWAVMMVSVLVYAGASQFLLISLLGSGAGLAASVSTVLLMNLRHVFYGPALATQLPAPGHGPQLPSPLLAFGLTDEVFATSMSKIGQVPPRQRQAWYAGMALGAYAAWIAGTACGTLLVGDLGAWPQWLRDGLAFVLPALFFTLLLDAGLRRWRMAVCTAALAAALLSRWLPAHHALVLAIVLGAACHALSQRQRALVHA
ncbi:branched-chain amino acid ABC transporter permease [Corticibacter populi]|uniref:Branched-chain amino acid ABC transporter permease n=1 Tax=Corticibacter populi TaxID=1550736 RepID=A0A3M6R052_9BURK|nr:AzlC family ABC transporter permease [Corticibacter populi]RMX08636.1 branched-chain amino acid ABC transporter permease [Corticibacter populi]